MREWMLTQVLLISGLLAAVADLLPGQQRYTPLPVPIVIIGREGAPDYEFAVIAAAHRLPSGDIAVLDWRTQGLRLFDAQGRLVRKLGREGAGPGEFRGLHDFFASGDTLIAFDSRLLRITRYHASGRLLGTQPVRAHPKDGSISVAGRLASGRWLVVTTHQPSWAQGNGLYRDTLRVGTLPPTTAGAVRWIADFPGASLFAYMPGENKSQWAAGWAFLAPTTIARVHGDTVLVGDTATPEVRYYTPDGRLVRRVSVPAEGPASLSALLRAERAKALLEAPPGANTEYLQAMYDAPRTVSRYRDFVVGTDGALWVRLYEERVNGPVRYLVLAPDGTIRARLSLPARSSILTVQLPWILAISRDEDDVERLAVIRWSGR